VRSRAEPSPSARARRYAQQVDRGKVPACRLVKLACRRFLRDLERKGSPWEYDAATADRVVRWIELMPHTKGAWAARGELLTLSDWQVFITCNIFGWLDRETRRRRFRKAYIEVPRKNGKALDVTTPVLTTRGWKAHGDLQPGDQVFAPDGRPVAVEQVTEHYPGPCYQLELADGEAIVAHARHEWVTNRTWYTGRKRGSRGALPPVETQRIAQTLRGGGRGDLVHSIDVCRALQLPRAALLIPPYTLGAWLGDGTSKSAAITTPDDEVVRAIAADGVEIFPRRYQPPGAATVYSMARRNAPGRLTPLLKQLGVFGNKHIPPDYLLASVEQRRDLLAGLFDADGHVTARGQCELVLMDRRLFDDAVALIRSLGLKPTVTESPASLRGRYVGQAFRAQFWASPEDMPLRVSRKRARLRPASSGVRRSARRMVTGCEPVGERMVNCIQVEGGLYLAGRHLVPTHNSAWAASIGLFMLCADGEFGAEVYSGATTEKQAWEIFRPARIMAQRLPALQEHYGLAVNAKTLNILENGSRFEALIGKPGDGASPSCALVDEFHEHDTADLIDTMQTGMGARDQPLLLIVTTAGSNFGGPCYEARGEVIKLLEGQFKDDRLFGIVYTLDEGDRWDSIDSVRKANPNYGVSVSAEFLEAQLAEARRSAVRQNAFRTKHLNQWVGARVSFFNMLNVARCARPGLRIEDFVGAECVVGIDLASKVDLASMAVVFDVGGTWKTFVRRYLPEDSLAEHPNKQFQAWADAGLITLTPGPVTDYDFIEEDLRTLARHHRVREIGYDPYQATQFAGHLQQEGFTVVEVRPTVLNFSEPMKELEARTRNQTFEYSGDPCLTWQFGNVVASLDAKDNVYPRKEREDNKIDDVVAILMAANRLKAQPKHPEIVGGLLVI
jgi:phage terminase large subunit-like protein